MPTYLYKCKTCGKEFEYQQRITADALTHCPEEICESQNKGQGIVERKISKNIGLVFNGKGFYLTDYVHKNDKAPSIAAKKQPTNGDSKKHEESTLSKTELVQPKNDSSAKETAPVKAAS